MKVFLIHDELREDRRKLYLKELEVQGIEAEIMSAVKTDMNVRKNISEAHKNCIRRAVAGDLERVVILEDDVKFSAPGAYNEFLRLSEDLPDDWDIFTAGSYDYTLKQGAAGHLQEPFTKLRRFAGLHCYMVNRKFYQGFLATRGVNNLDKALTGNLYMMVPMAAVQHDGYSANTGKQTNYNIIFAKKIRLWKNPDLKS